jgi:hypothetical protein
MNHEELSDLILSIKLTVNDDYQSGFKTTQYKLPEAALAENVVEALRAHFEHYDSVRVAGNILTLEHPRQDEKTGDTADLSPPFIRQS